MTPNFNQARAWESAVIVALICLVIIMPQALAHSATLNWTSIAGTVATVITYFIKGADIANRLTPAQHGMLQQIANGTKQVSDGLESLSDRLNALLAASAPTPGTAVPFATQINNPHQVEVITTQAPPAPDIKGA